MTDHALEAPTEDDVGTAPPNDRRAETAVLGAMLRAPAEIAEITERVTGAHFYAPRHERIFDAIDRRVARLEPVDTHLIALDLAAAGDLDRCGGEAYLEHLFGEGIAVPVDSALYYADIVRRLAGRRRLDTAGRRISELAHTHPDLDLTDLHQLATDELDPDKVIPTIPGVDTDTGTHPWQPVDIAAVLAGDLDPPRATIGTRRDGQALFYPAAVHSIAGEPGCGKTWVALIVAAQELEDGHDVGIIDFEDRAETHVARLRALGVTDEALSKHLRYIRPQAPLDARGWGLLAKSLNGCRFIVVDGVTEAMSLHGLEINDQGDVARWIHLLPARLADLGAAVVQIDHVTKNGDTRGRYAIGAQHKLAAISGAAYGFQVIKSFGKGQHGHAKLIINKDRHADVGPTGGTAADVHLDATDAGSTYGWLDHPTRDVDDEGHFRPTTLMQRVSDFLLATPGAATLNQIKVGVKGKNESIVTAVDALVREGNIRTEPGPRGSTMHHLVTSFEAPR